MLRLYVLIFTAALLLVSGATSAQNRGIAFSIAWSPDSEKIAVGSSTGIWFFDTDFNELGYVDVRIDDEQWNWPISIEWNAASDLLAVAYPVTGAEGGAIQVIDFANLVVITRIDTVHWEEWLWSQVAWHPTDNLLAAGTWLGKAFVWDALTGEAEFEFEESDEQNAFAWNSTVTVCWLSESVIAVVTQWEIYIVDTEVNRTVQTLDTGSPMQEVDCYAFDRIMKNCGDAINVAICSWGYGSSNFSRAQRQTFLGAPKQWAPLYIADISYSPDGSKALTLGEGCLLHVTDSDTGLLLADLAGGVIVEQDGYLNVFRDSLTWRPDGRQFAAVGQFGGISVWDADTYDLLQRFEGFDVSYEQTTPVNLEDLAGDELRWFNSLKMKCIEDLNAGRNTVLTPTLTHASSYDMR